MKATDLIRFALQMTDQGTANIVAELRNHPMAPSTPGGKAGDGNHPIWLLGHLCVVEGWISGMLTDKPSPVEAWVPLFEPGSQPKTDASAYPSFDEVLAKFHSIRADNLKLLDTLDDAGLDRKPNNIPPGFEDAMKNVGQSLLIVALHNMVHYGEAADVRRVVGLKPLM